MPELRKGALFSLRHVESTEQSSTDHNHVRVLLIGDFLLRDQPVQPRGVDGIILELTRFEKLNQVLDGSADFTAHDHALESEHERLARFVASFAGCKDVTKLGISKLVHATIGADREVTPHVGRRLELHALDATRRRLETFIRVLGGDARCDDVSLRQDVIFFHEVNTVHRFRVTPVKGSNFRDALERNTHGNLQLRRGKVDAGDAFRHRVLDLQTRVQFKEEVLVRCCVVQVFNRTSTNVTNILRQTLRRLFHFSENFRLGNRRRTFLKDLLESTLRGAITTVQGNGITVLVTDNLHFQVTRLRTKLHHEHRRARDFSLDLLKVCSKLLFIRAHTNTLTTTTFRRFQHDRETDAFRRRDALLDRRDHRLVENFFRNRALLRQLCDETVARPRNRRNLGGLRQNIGRNLIA